MNTSPESHFPFMGAGFIAQPADADWPLAVETDEGHSERVAMLRKAIANGSYDELAILERVLDTMIDEFEEPIREEAN